MSKNAEELLELMREDLNQIKEDVEVIKVKLNMLEKVVYGAVGIVLVAVLTAAMALLIKQ